MRENQISINFQRIFAFSSDLQLFLVSNIIHVEWDTILTIKLYFIHLEHFWAFFNPKCLDSDFKQMPKLVEQLTLKARVEIVFVRWLLDEKKNEGNNLSVISKFRDQIRD